MENDTLLTTYYLISLGALASKNGLRRETICHYNKEMEIAMIRANIKEDQEATTARFQA